MKKFFLMIMMALFTVSMTSAQVHEGKMFDNIYTTVSVSGVLPTTDFQVGTTEFRKNWRPEFGIEVGKQVTTLYTTGLEFTAGVNTTGVKTAFDDMSLLWMHKVNVSNFHSYTYQKLKEYYGMSILVVTDTERKNIINNLYQFLLMVILVIFIVFLFARRCKSRNQRDDTKKIKQFLHNFLLLFFYIAKLHNIFWIYNFNCIFSKTYRRL